MFEKFIKQAEKIVAAHKAQYQGVYYMKGGVIGSIEHGISNAVDNLSFNKIRDAAETIGVEAGNYFLPGSALLTSQVASKGSKGQLSSPLGVASTIGTGLAGAGVGSSVTGIPQSAGGAAEGAALSSIGSAIGDAASSAGNALGITDTASAAPWVNPDAVGTVADSTSATAPWSSPDTAVTPGANAAASDIGSNTDAFGNPIDTTTAAGANPNNLTGNGINIGSTALGDVVNPAGTAGTSLSNISTPALTNDAGQPIGSSLASAASGGGSATGAGGIMSALKTAGSLAGPLVSGTGLALAALKGSKPIPAATALNTQAATDATQGATLQNYLTTGTLPQGAQAGIDQAKNSAKAAIRSKYASMGMSGSSSEQQELAAADSNAQAQGEQEALQLLNSGISESQMSSQLYENILNNTMQQDQNLSSAVGNFASSLAGTAGTSTGKNNVTSNV